MNILDGKKTAFKYNIRLKKYIEDVNLDPSLAVIVCKNDKVSMKYAKIKEKVCKDLGISVKNYYISNNTNQEDIIEMINKLNDDDSVNGILVQTPLPEHINSQEVLDYINPEKDIDGLSSTSIGRLYSDRKCHVPCTALGILKLLEEYKINIEGKKVVIINRSNLIGKPLEKIMLDKNATVVICHSKTTKLASETKSADILISATGKKNLITADMIKKGAVVIDAGIGYDKGKVHGDVDFENVKEKASYITPVPGGVGPMTIAMLVKNLVEACEKQELESRIDFNVVEEDIEENIEDEVESYSDEEFIINFG